jgi:hypothetical protein
MGVLCPGSCILIVVFPLCCLVASFSGLSIFYCPFVLPVSLDCPFCISPSVFSNVYL